MIFDFTTVLGILSGQVEPKHNGQVVSINFDQLSNDFDFSKNIF